MQETGERWRLGHRPALDGLRGVAVLLVVVSHLAPMGSWVRGLGGAGVVAFFTLSGFLITSLLLEERERSGRVDLGAFYLRRARRLFPAAASVIAVVGVAGLFLGSAFSGGWALVAGAATYSANWVLAAGHGTGSALSHTWSLSIEEQFYLAWPAVLLVIPRRYLAGALAFAVAVTALLPFALWDGSNWARVADGSDVRAMPLLVGCLLAVLMHGRREGRSRPAIAGFALAAVVAATLHGAVFLQLVTPSLVALATALAIWAVAQAGEVRWLTPSWLVLVGKRSYGLYLWHWPVVVLAEQQFGLSGVQLAAVVLPFSAVLTGLSWRYIERPFLTKGRSRESARALNDDNVHRLIPAN